MMADDIKIPAFTIKADGNELPQDIRINGIMTWHALNRIGWAEVHIADSRKKDEPFPASNNASLTPGKSLEILLGRGKDNATDTVFKGSITGTRLSYEKGKIQLVIECRDDAYQMTLVPKTVVFTEETDSAICNTVLGNYDGLTASFDSTETEIPRVLQHQTTDWDFVLTRLMIQSQLISSYCGDITSKKSDGSSGTPYTQEIDNTLIRFDANMDSRDQIDSYDMLSWDLENQEVVKSSSTKPSVKDQGSVSPDTLASAASLTNSTIIIGTAGSIESTTAQAVADALLLQSRLSKIRCEIEVIGRADMKPGDLITLSEFGALFDGDALINEVEQNLTSGKWTTTIRTGLSRDWVMDKLVDKGGVDVFPERLLGQLHIGKVTKISEDPDNITRAQVNLPLVYGTDAEDVWARVMSFSAGNNRGAFFMPNAGDEVLVGFVGSNNQNPIILGKLYSQNRTSPITPADENNYIKGYYSDSEMKLEFDDEKPSVSLSTPGGAEVTLDDDAGSLTLKDQNGNSIIMDSSGITVECSGDYTLSASKGAISESGMSLDLSADQSFSAKGNSGAELTSPANTTIKGAMVQIN